MKCVIDWTSLGETEWTERFAGLPRSSLLQGQDYAQALYARDRLKTRQGLIVIDGREAGLVRILETGLLWNAVHALILDRGPLWFEGFGGAAHIGAVFTELDRQFPRRFGRKRRILPEVEDGPAARAVLRQTGLQRLEDRAGYRTLWLDLRPEPDLLRAAMKPNWRNKLNKSERAGLELVWDREGRDLPWFLKIYTADKNGRGYDGPPPELLGNLAARAALSGNMLIGRAVKEKKNIAAILILRHGRAATYQAGWSSVQGREHAAHHLLLWQAALMLKQDSVEDLDLGGINDDSAAGVKTFKEGLGGTEARYVGHYT